MAKEPINSTPVESRSSNKQEAGRQDGPQETGCEVDGFNLADFENAADGICVCHPIDDFPYVRFVYWNRKMFELSGYDLETINRKGWYQSVYPDPDIRRRAIDRMSQMRVGDNLEAEEWEIVRSDGQLRTVRISTSIIDSSVGEPLVMAIMHDVTQLKKAKEKLTREKEALKQKLADADQALEVSDTRYRALFEHAGDAIFIHDLEGTIIDVNQKTLDMLGYSKRELLSIKVPMLHPPESLEQSKWAFETIMQDGQVTFEIGFIAKNGEVVPAEVTSSIYDSNGSQFIQGIARDIRERQMAEQARRETFGIIESSPVTVFLWQNAPEWPVEFVTRNVACIFGYSDDDFQSGKVPYSQVIHPEDLERVSREVANASQDTDRTEFEHEPYRIVTSDGDTRWVNDKTFIRRDNTGAITHYQGIVEDITTRIAAEEALRESEEKFSRAFHSSPDAIIISHLQTGTILEVNEGFVFISGHKREEVIGKTTIDINLWADPVDRDRYEKMMTENGRARNLEFCFRLKSGEIRYGLLSGELVEIGTEKCLLGTIRDINDKKRAEEQLTQHRDHLEELVRERTSRLEQEIDERKKAEGQIAASLAEKEILLREIHHRVKNNLNTVSNLLYLQSRTLDEDRMQGAFRESRNRIQTMARVHELLYRSESLAEIDMNAYLEELAADLAEAYPSRPAVFHTGAAGVTLAIDQAIPCGLIITELVSNALKYAFAASAPENRISIEISTQGDEYRLVVADNGVGLPEGMNVAQARSLGLRLVMMLTRQLQGDVAIKSAPGQGAHFAVAFKAIEPEQEP